MKEMVGGCCVCSDERGWQENPLVYCDGPECSVAVHQACYGIVSVPTGPWFCEKCEAHSASKSQDMSRFRCDLCPMREGALKRTDKNGWAHVVCALYIPEVRFGNVTTMDPIILSQVPPDRFSKVCYICEEKGLAEKAKVGACMTCNRGGCKTCFHVTCAQQEGLLCEESGHMDNIKYCGYCSHHFKKLKRDPSVKAIPPYRPVGAVSSSGLIAPADLANKEKSSMNNSKNLVDGNRALVNNSNNNNHHSPNPRDNCVRTSPLTTTIVSSNAPASNTNSAVTASNPTAFAATTLPATSGHLRSTTVTAAAASGVFIPAPPSSISAPGPSLPPSLPQPSPSVSRPLVTADGGPDASSPPWTKPVVPHIYLGFNNDMLHSNTSGHVVVGATSANTLAGAPTVAPAAISGPALGALAPIAAISSVLPPSGFAVKAAAPAFASNSSGANMNQPRTTTSATGPVSTAPVEGVTAAHVAGTPTSATGHGATKSKATATGGADRKRKSEKDDPNPGVSGNAESTGEKPKKPRRSSTKKTTVKSLLELVSPMVEDTVSSFQREKLASQRGEVLQQPIHQQQQHMHQHQQSSIDSVIAATAAGHPSSHLPAAAILERPSAPAPAAVVVPEVVEQPALSIPIANIIGPPPPPKSAPFRSPQEASTSLAGASAFPSSLEQLLERQWEQGSQFLMEQAQHFDIASLLSCLHQLKMENQRLEDHVVSLASRRDHLLAVNARLSISLGQHQSPNSPRVSTVAPVATPFLHLQAPNTQDSSHDTSENSASSRMSAPPNTSTPVALHQPFVGATIVPVVTTTKVMPTPTTTAAPSSVVVSPTNRSALGPLTAAVASPNFAMIPGVSGVGGGVFSSVKSNKLSQEPSPDRQQQPAPGPFLMPRAPTPLLPADLVRPQSSLVSNQYPVTQDHHQRMFYQLMQQNAVAAVYGNAFSTLMQSTSPHRAMAAAVLAQSHLPPPSAAAGPPSTQEKS